MTSEIHCRGRSTAAQTSEQHGSDEGRRAHLLLHVVQRIRGVYSEANKDDVGVGVAEGAKPVVVFLAGSIPQRELDVLSIHLDIGDVVLEHGRDVDLLGRCERQWDWARWCHVCGAEAPKTEAMGGGGRGHAIHTSGKVPLEKTIKRQVYGGRMTCEHGDGTICGCCWEHLSASTVADDDELPANFRHGGRVEEGRRG